jgi:DNA-directed RNA polymerase subunit RPC12/RpoP
MSKPEKEIECWGTDEIVCPHCGHEMSDSWEYLDGNRTKGSADCGECEKTFKWEAEYSVTYTTETCACLNGTPCVMELEKFNSREGEYEYHRCKECGEGKFTDLRPKESAR